MGGNFTPCWFSRNKSETVKAATLQPWDFAAFSKIYWRHSCQVWYSYLAPFSIYWAKLRRGYFRFPVNPLQIKIVTTPKPVMILTWDLDQQLKLTRKTRQRQTNFTMTSCQQIVMSLWIFPFIANLEQSESRIPESWSVEITFALTIIFYLTKTKNRTKKSLTHLSYHCFD